MLYVSINTVATGKRIQKLRKERNLKVHEIMEALGSNPSRPFTNGSAGTQFPPSITCLLFQSCLAAGWTISWSQAT